MTIKIKKAGTRLVYKYTTLLAFIVFSFYSLSLIAQPYIEKTVSKSKFVLPQTSEGIYRPTHARFWKGHSNHHKFAINKSIKAPFPPFEWKGKGLNSGEAWYEFDIPHEKLPEELAGILITRVYLTADVYLNGKMIGSGGSMQAPLAKNAHRPLYFNIPQSAWQTGKNTIRIHHKSYPNMGYVVDVLIANDSVLRPVYEQRHFQQQSIPKVLFIIEILSALFLFYIWLSQKKESAYLWFSISMFMISVFTLNQFLINTIIPHRIWLIFNNTSIDWWAISLILFVNQRLEIDRPLLINTLLIYSVCAFVYYLSLPLNRLPGTTVFHALSMLLILINIFYIAFKANKKQALPYIIFFSSLLLMALHDILMQSGLWATRWLDGHFILFYAAPLACFLVFGKIIREFVQAMHANKSHAENLQMHIEITKQELEQQYEKLQAIAENKAIENERERIYRDLHDDVGAKLLSLFYRANDLHLESLAKSALEDLRDIVSRKTLNGEQLENAIIQWQNEAQERINEQGIKLTWTHDKTSSQFKLNESQFTHAKRMLREAISNALRHNKQTTEIKIHIALEESKSKNTKLSIEVSNNGLENNISQWQHGRGINNMIFRARELGGSVNITSEQKDLATLTWTIPIQKL